MNLAVLTAGLPEAPKTLVDATRIYVNEVDGCPAVFARGPIFKGELAESGMICGQMSTGMSCCYTSKSDPNCEVKRSAGDKRFEIFALRDIRQNEQLTLAEGSGFAKWSA